MPKAFDQSTRDRILDAAVAEIAEAGWGGARTRSIAERAGVNNALVHYHFSSMEDLLVAATAATLSALASEAAGSIGDADLATSLFGIIDSVASADPEQPGWQVLIEAMLHTRRVPALADMSVDLIDRFRQAIAHRLDAAVGDGSLPATTDTEGLALALMALIDGLGLYAYVDSGLDVRRAATALITLITRGFDT